MKELGQDVDFILTTLLSVIPNKLNGYFFLF